MRRPYSKRTLTTGGGVTGGGGGGGEVTPEDLDAKVDVAGDLMTGPLHIVEDTSALGTRFLGASSNANPFTLSTTLRGVFVVLSAVQTGNSADFVTANTSGASLNLGGFDNTSAVGVTGAFYTCGISGGGTCTVARGGLFTGSSSGAGTTVTNLRGGEFTATTSSSGVTTTSQAGRFTATGTGHGTLYGVYVTAMTGGTVANYGAAIEAAGTQTLWLANTTQPTTAAGGIAFGSARDTQIYRTAANTIFCPGLDTASSWRVLGASGNYLEFGAANTWLNAPTEMVFRTGGGTRMSFTSSATQITTQETNFSHAAPRLNFGTSGITIRPGAGDPNSSVTAPVGSLYLRTDGGAGTTLYVKESGTGNTGWVAK